jgi:multidrug efflux pump subunit AcrA (membrane-fusion protein)
MTWPNRLRLFLGLIVVIALAGVCTVVFNQRQSTAQSTSASIQADQYSVGTTYGGTVVAQHVEEGDVVEAGDPLFEVQSLQLAKDLEEEVLEPDDLIDTDPETGTYSIVATVDGTVSEIVTPAGDFAPTGGVVATIDREGSLTVTAEYFLTARDYGRVAEGAGVELTLPDDAVIVGEVDDIEVETVGNQARSTITIVSATLVQARIGGLYQPGTPVSASIELRDDGVLAGVTDSIRDFVRQVSP